MEPSDDQKLRIVENENQVVPATFTIRSHAVLLLKNGLVWERFFFWFSKKEGHGVGGAGGARLSFYYDDETAQGGLNIVGTVRRETVRLVEPTDTMWWENRNADDDGDATSGDKQEGWVGKEMDDNREDFVLEREPGSNWKLQLEQILSHEWREQILQRLCIFSYNIRKFANFLYF